MIVACKKETMKGESRVALIPNNLERRGGAFMTREEARKIANYALPTLLQDLPMHMKLELLRHGKFANKESLFEHFAAKLADTIQWAATEIENKKREQYI